MAEKAASEMAEGGLRAVLFDLDDTLHDRTAAGCRRAEAWVDQYLTPATPAARADAVAWLVALDDGGYGPKSEILRRLQERNPSLDWDAPTFTRLFVEALIEHMALPEDARRLLETLRDRHVPWGIVTNGSRTQRDKIVHLGLHGLTDCVFVSGEFGCKKPDRRIFAAAAECLGFAPQHILFVGDHCENDIVGAASADMKTAWLSQGRSWPGDKSDTPDYILNSLADLGPILNLA